MLYFVYPRRFTLAVQMREQLKPLTLEESPETDRPRQQHRAKLSHAELAPPVLVLGQGITALGVMRRLGQLGIRTYVVTDQPEFLRGSRWYRPLTEIADETPRSGALAAWLSHQKLSRAVLIPCSDEAVLEIASLPLEMADLFRASVPPISTVRTLVDKHSFAQLLQNAGIPHPRTELITSEADLDRIDNEFLRRGFLKPTQSQAFFREFKQKAFRISDRSDARDQIKHILNRGHGLIIQEMIEGPANHQLCIDGFVDRTGQIRARFARRWLQKHPADFGESCLAVSVRLDDVSEAVELAESVIRLLPYRGVFSVELKMDEREKRYRVLEVNARPWWYVGFTCTAGIDVCAMTYRDALNETVPEMTVYRTGLYAAYPELHWHVNRSLPRHERMGTLSMLNTWVSAVQPVFSWADPGPWMLSVGKRLRRRLSFHRLQRA